MGHTLGFLSYIKNANSAGLTSVVEKQQAKEEHRQCQSEPLEGPKIIELISNWIKNKGILGWSEKWHQKKDIWYSLPIGCSISLVAYKGFPTDLN